MLILSLLGLLVMVVVIYLIVDHEADTLIGVPLLIFALCVLGFVKESRYKINYPLVKDNREIITDTYEYNDTIFKFEKKVIIEEYYHPTPRYYVNGGKSQIMEVKVRMK